MLLYVLPGQATLFPVHLSFIFLPTSRFEVYVLHPVAPVCVYRSCRTENRFEGVPTQAFVSLGRYGYTCSLSSPTQTPGTMQRPLAPIEERRGDGDVCASSLPPLAAYIRYFPLVPVQRQSSELRATTVGECRRRYSLRRHKGGRWTVCLTSRHHVLQGGFNVSLPCVQHDCGGSGGHGSAPGGALTPPR